MIRLQHSTKIQLELADVFTWVNQNRIFKMKTKTM